MSVKCIILRQNYGYREITTSDLKITIIPVIGLLIRWVFDITSIAPLKTFPSERNTYIMGLLGGAAECVGDSRDFKCAHVHWAVTEHYCYITDIIYILFRFLQCG